VVLWLLISTVLAATPPRGAWTAAAHFDAMADQVRADVESYVSDVGFLKRPFARWALVHATAPCARIEIRDQADALAIACDDHKVAVAPPDGSTVSFTGDDGRTMDLVHAIDGQGAVVQTFANKNGTRTNRFTS